LVDRDGVGADDVPVDVLQGQMEVDERVQALSFSS